MRTGIRSAGVNWTTARDSVDSSGDLPVILHPTTLPTVLAGPVGAAAAPRVGVAVAPLATAQPHQRGLLHPPSRRVSHQPVVQPVQGAGAAVVVVVEVVALPHACSRGSIAHRSRKSWAIR